MSRRIYVIEDKEKDSSLLTRILGKKEKHIDIEDIEDIEIEVLNKLKVKRTIKDMLKVLSDYADKLNKRQLVCFVETIKEVIVTDLLNK